MHDLVRTHREAAVVGWACRLPGASCVDDLWSLLANGRCAVTRIPADRFARDRYWHPRHGTRGRSYTFAAGVIDNVWGFDPAVFGISPREAAQMDPQQRLALELVWEALENAGLPPSALAGREVGVFAGASSIDFAALQLLDPAACDAYTMTGSTLSLIANRISYVFDLRGPSYTVDTACSSSLVALEQALASLSSGRIEIAVVVGVNVLTGANSFVGFSQASMLSPSGLCRAFDAQADGYVRAEGGVALVLRSSSGVDADRDVVHGAIVGAGVNSDGRTAGVSLPSSAAQKSLLERVYRSAGVDPNELVFLEAHGTGTQAGDPAEATAVGEALARRRTQPLPIGSIKTNVGHLEPASGLAGVLKAMLALKHDLLPASLHFNEPNPRIPFEKLNVAVCNAPQVLSRTGARRYAGVNSFGFGGTNAHVVVADPPKLRTQPRRRSHTPQLLVISAQSQPALAALAERYAGALEAATPEAAAALAAAAGHRRQWLPHRLAVEIDSPKQTADALRRYARGGPESLGITAGVASERDAPCAFIYSGNGSQWPGMGRAAYAASAAFRERFDEADALFARLAGWSLRENLFSDALEEKLALTHIAQPLTFAVQSAATYALRQAGLRPAVTLGHSVGEIAAAEAAGILDFGEALRVIHYRSLHQELARGSGRMAVVFAEQSAVEALTQAIDELEIAAFNSSRAFTVSGPAEAIDALDRLAAERRIRIHRLDLDYPFHSRRMQPVERPLLADLADLSPLAGEASFVSTVTGDVMAGPLLDAHYWWRNVREPVLFRAAVQKAAELGARSFIEIGPRGTLAAHIADTLRERSVPFALVNVLEREQPPGDPFRRALALALVSGARVETARVVGDDPGPHVALPHYPWQRAVFRMQPSTEAVRLQEAEQDHPLLGWRPGAELPEWHAVIDLALRPELADHRVHGQVRFPGSGFVELALAAARAWTDTDAVGLADFDIVQWMSFPDDKQREVMTRISPAAQIVEIFSRPRLTNTAWQLHARGRILRQVEAPPLPAMRRARHGERTNAETLYARASACGLQYGPAFRKVESVIRSDESTFEVELLPPEEASPYALDPARLDACFHPLVLLLPQQGETLGQVHVPVRMGEVRLVKPGALPVRARVEIEQANPRGVLAHFLLLDADGETVCLVRDARFQAVRARAPAELATHAFVQKATLAPQAPDALLEQSDRIIGILDRLEPLGLERLNGHPVSKDVVLLEGWAMAAALALVRAVAQSDGPIDVDALIAADRLPLPMRSWFVNLLHALAASKLAEADGERWHLLPDRALPDAQAILRTLAAEHPNRSAELLAAAAIDVVLARLRERGAAAFTAPAIAPWIVDALDIGGALARSASEALVRLISGVAAPGRPLQLLQIGYGPLSHRLVPFLRRHEASLTILEFDRRRYERAAVTFEGERRIEVRAEAGDLPPGRFDLIVSSCGLHRSPAGVADLAALAQAGAAGALLLAVEPPPSLFRDLVCGLDPDWFDTSAAGLPAGRLRSAAAWSELLAEAGFAEAVAQPIATEGEESILLLAAVPARPALAAPASLSLWLLHAGEDRQGALASALASDLLPAGHRVQIAAGDEPALLPRDARPPDHVVVLLGQVTADPVEAITGIALRLRRIATALGGAQTVLWLVAPAGTPVQGPLDSAIAAFARTLANEFANLDVRRLALAPMPPAAAAARLKDVLLSGTKETDLLVTEEGLRLLRVEGFDDTAGEAAMPSAPGARLQRGAAGGLERLAWVGVDRRAPQAGEIEIAVQAVGLNFRDVMFALSLLPEDLLEDGFAGPTLGLECAGRVLRVGASVTGLAPGDRVIAFAPAAFSSHVTVPAHVACRIPEHVSFEAAATIPVAFSTAYYSLRHLAELRRGDWVLIHGGAGGVGLAALQIARVCKARVIATAGSEEKRALLRMMGAEHVLDSRSLAFADEVRRIAGEGVHVVLNSLSGEAMELSLKALQPFGRFVELGKRDYVANTQLGLRPFRKNISYFAADLDQLLVRRPKLGLRLFREIMQLFERRLLHPLPHRVFSAQETVEAFRLMQQAGHVGKIVVQPPQGEVRRRAPREFGFAADRTHLVTGAFGGFGAEAARFLARRGARHLVLLGRSGAASPEAARLVQELEAQGVHVLAAACDVADAAALAALFKRIDATMPPLAGVIHAAMVLADGVIANLDAAQLEQVLRPKIAGAENLHQLTRHRALDYFVLFSSATTFLGNPGQAAYVAANGYLEGLARRRRAEGLPALAVAFGPIGDVGVLAGNRKIAEALTHRLGVEAMESREALELMAEAMAVAHRGSLDQAVIAVGAVDWSAAHARLPVLASPSYDPVRRLHRAGEGSDSTRIDLAAVVAQDGADAARKLAMQVIIEEVSRVLRIPRDDLNPYRPLAESGLDSLMAVELAMSLQDRFGLEGQALGSATGLSIAQIAAEVVATVGGGAAAAGALQAAARRHLAEPLPAETISAAAAEVEQRAAGMQGLIQ